MNGHAQLIGAWVIVAHVFVVVIFDMVMGFRYGADYTISRQLLWIGQQYPILPVLIGIAVGHVFWPQRN